MTFNPIDHPVCVLTPHRLTNVYDFQPHIPVAMLFISLLRPARVVELGSYLGDSLCSMVQASRQLGLPTRFTAVDTWTGDPLTGVYGEEIITDLRAYLSSAGYAEVSLLRKLTSEAASDFDDNSIDLLLIDADHTFDGVSADYTNYLPKLAPNGVILFHDTHTVNFIKFGVWKLWSALRARYAGAWFEFPHAWGVGAIAPKGVPPAFAPLCKATPEETRKIQTFFEALGNTVLDHSDLIRILRGEDPAGVQMDRLAFPGARVARSPKP